MKKKILIPIVSVLAFLLLCGAAFGVYVSDYYRADETVRTACVSDSAVTVTEKDGNMIFAPASTDVGFIFYPGGKVENTAYAPLMKKCAEKGVLCILLKVNFNLAILDGNAADGVKEQYPQITHWYVGGHSLGGVVAAQYLAKEGAFDGLVLLAAYSTKKIDSSVRVLSIYGENDGVMNRDKYEENRTNLPENTNEIVLSGGCHAGFGSYGAQKGDGTPTLTSDEQQNKTADAIAEFTRTEAVL